MVAAGGEERAAEHVVRQAEGRAHRSGWRRHRPPVAVELVRAGASEYFALPEDYELLRAWLRENRRIGCGSPDQRTAFADSERQKYRFEGILGESSGPGYALDQAAKIIPHADVTVLITGETRHRQGAGRARHPRRQSPRARRPFVAVNCAAIPEQLLESELFGHEKGAFTGADSAQAGPLRGGRRRHPVPRRDRRHLPLTLQAKLLRVLQEREFERVGGTRPITRRRAGHRRDQPRPRARWSSAGTFREDLYYRLNVVRDRRCRRCASAARTSRAGRHFLDASTPTYGRRRRGSTPRRRVAAAREHDWPGNIRELRNTIERAVLLGSRRGDRPERSRH